MLQSLGGKLNRSNDVHEIGTTIANELRPLIDYHNCRVFLRDGDELVPIGFQGQLTGTGVQPAQAFTTRVGEGITGHVVATGESLILGDASKCEFAVEIAGTEEIEESIVAVPLEYGTRVIGAIVVSKLGLDQFDEDDGRLLEVLAGHGAVALENARLYEAQRREAESAKALLEFGRSLAGAEGLDRVLELVVEGAAQILDAPHASLWLQDEPGGDLVGRAGIGFEARLRDRRTPLPARRGRSCSRREASRSSSRAEEYSAFAEPPAGGTGSYAAAPFFVDGRWGTIAVASKDEVHLRERELELLGGLAHQAKLAIANASSFEGLEKTFLSTVEALANALEARDYATSSHTRWITDTALRSRRRAGARRRDDEAARARRALPRHR